MFCWQNYLSKHLRAKQYIFIVHDSVWIWLFNLFFYYYFCRGRERGRQLHPGESTKAVSECFDLSSRNLWNFCATKIALMQELNPPPFWSTFESCSHTTAQRPDMFTILIKKCTNLISQHLAVQDAQACSYIHCMFEKCVTYQKAKTKPWERLLCLASAEI